MHFECSYAIKMRFFSHGSAALAGLGLLYEIPRSHSDTPHTVALLWTGDRLVAEPSI